MSRVEEMASELVQAGRMLSDEVGDYWVSLGEMSRFVGVSMNNAFGKAWKHEVEKWHQVFKDDYRFVTYTETRPVTKTVLMHIDDMEACEE